MQVLCQEFMSTHFRIRYGNIGCQILQVREGYRNYVYINFWPKVNIYSKKKGRVRSFFDIEIDLKSQSFALFDDYIY